MTALASALAALAGCGLRVDGSEVKAANAAAVGVGSGGGTGGGGIAAGGGTGTGGATGPSQAQGPTAGPQGATSDNGSSTATGGQSGTASGDATQSGTSGTSGSSSGVAPPAPAGGNGGATDVGVTATSITVGNVSDLGGPVPGLFQGGPYGVQAYFNYINSQGGVYGRKLILNTQDDQLQCNQDEASYADLVNKVFAFVGGWSLYDNCGATVLAQHPNVPVLNQALSPEAENLKGTYNIQPFLKGVALGPFNYYKAKFPDAITKVGTLVGNVPSAVAAWNYNQQGMESLGYKIIYKDVFPPANTNFTADVIRMKSAGVKMVYMIAVNAPDLAAFSQAAYQQGFKPEVFASGIGYFGSYVSESGGPAAVEGQYVNLVQAMFLGEDASTVPEVALFQHWISQSFPNFPIDQFSATSWANAALFVKALVAAGDHPTRAKLLAALASIHDWNDNNFEGPVDVGAKSPAHGYLIVQIKNGKYVKVDDPPTGYRTDDPFYAYHG